MPKKYLPRIADNLLKDQLDAMGAVLVQGPKWCGKTTTSKQQSASVLKMDKPDERVQNLQLSQINPSRLLQGHTPRLIDEWQIAPTLWDAVRYEVDERGTVGQFILTGSAVPADSTDIFHSGTGRFAWLTMRPMSLMESLDSTGTVSLSALFRSQKTEDSTSLLSVDGESSIDIDRLAFLCCRGGWPQVVGTHDSAALRQAINYFDGVVSSDIQRASAAEKDEHRARLLMRSYARNLGTQASLTVLEADMAANESITSSHATIATYLKALREIFVIEDMPAWNPNLRSRSAIRTSDTRYFTDPSIATSALGLGPDDLIADLNTFGFVFESLCVRDLRVYADALDGHVAHFRDSNGLECDAVLHLRNGKYGLIEIKLGGAKPIDDAAATLKKLASKIDTTRMREPSFLMVLTGVGQYPYTRDDGVLVVPIGSLGI